MDSKKPPHCVAPLIWRYSRILLLALGFFLFSSQDANASHLAGADITYEWLSQNQYLVTLILYRDCDGIGMPTSVNLTLSSASCGLNPPSVIAPLDTSYEISQLCPSEINNSTCGTGTGIYPGYEIWIYSGIVNFPTSCSDWIVSWNTCCRNASVAGVTGTLTAAPSLYIECMINTFYSNSSPTFTSNPIPYFCAGICYQYNQGAFDPENDTLRYALTCPLNTPGPGGVCIPHKPGMSPVVPIQTAPVGTFGFSNITGQMNFCTAAGLAQFGALAVTVYNVKNGDTIGYVQRDIQMIVLNNVNCTSPVGAGAPTVISGTGSFDAGANTFIVCAGETLVFDLIVYDSDGNTITLDPTNTNLDQVFGAGNWTSFLNTNLPFRPDSAQIFISIFANASNLGVNNFTLGLTDGACPIPGDVILGYNLIVPGVEVSASDTTICPGIAQQIQLNANSFSTVGAIAAGSFAWTQVSGPTITFSDDTLPSPIALVPAGTADGDSIVMMVTFTTLPAGSGAGCITTDSVIIYLQALPLNLNVYATETSLCPNNETDTISFATAISGPGIDLFNGIYTWTSTPSSNLSNLTSTAINNPSAYLSGGPNDQVTYAVNYAYGLCEGTDSVTLTWRPTVPVISAAMDTICPGDTTSVMAFLSDTIPIVSPGACSVYTVTPITYAPIAGTGTGITLIDDQYSSTLPIGFNFNFFCANRTQFRIASNGFITFDLLTGAPSWSATLIPNGVTNPNDMIAAFFTDLNPASGGTIDYFTTGVVPNRQLVVNFTNVDRIGGASSVTGQIVLHEGTNIIDIYTAAAAAGPNTTQGIENTNGTLGVSSPGRNQSVWSATNDGYRFEPGSVFITGAISYLWDPGYAVSNAGEYNPDAFPQGTTMFTVSIEDGGCVLTDSIEIFVQSLIPPPAITCGTPFNQATSVLFEWGGSPSAAGWEYSTDSGNTWVPAPLQDSFLLVTGLTNGTCANILVRGTGGAGPCPTNASTYLECCTTPCPMSNTSALTNLTCFASLDGAIDVSISGGILGDHPTFTGILYDIAGVQVGTSVSNATNVVFTGLAAGTYYAYLTDTFGCFTNSDTVIITQPDTLMVTEDTTSLTTCFTDSDGTGTVQAIGGTTSYTWLWDATAGSQTTIMATGLAVGTYPVTVTDANGCMDVTNVMVYSPFPNAPALTLTNTMSSTCTGDGTATVFSTFNMVGNANNYTFAWSNGNTGPTAMGLAPGTATVTITDVNGCPATASTTIIGSPTLTIDAMPTINPGCAQFNGQITASAIGDSTGYTYQWSANTNFQTTALVTGLGVGTYTVTVTGVTNGCVVTQSTQLVNTSALSIVGFNSTDPSCGINDGSAGVLTTGAAGTLTFAWTPGGANTNPINNLAPGTYSVIVTDLSTNCSDVQSVVLNPSASPTATLTANNASCNISNGSITAVGANVAGPFTYLWDDALAQTTPTAQGLAPGTYSCIVTYQGCSITAGPVTISNDTLEIAITDYDDLTCNLDGSSYVNVSLLAGTNPAYAWSSSTNSSYAETTQNISGLTPGTYTVTATSGTCVATQSITIQDIQLSLNAGAGVSSLPNLTIQIGEIATIDAGQSTNHANPIYGWTMSSDSFLVMDDSSALVTTVQGLENGITWLYFTDTAGTSQDAGPCAAMDSILITVESYLGMPTAFTPNGDGINDIFLPVSLNNSDKVYKFEIYNRWGQVLYSDPVNYQWDGNYLGTPQPTDVYIYVFQYYPDQGDLIEIRGEFTLIR